MRLLGFVRVRFDSRLQLRTFSFLASTSRHLLVQHRLMEQRTECPENWSMDLRKICPPHIRFFRCLSRIFTNTHPYSHPNHPFDDRQPNQDQRKRHQRNILVPQEIFRSKEFLLYRPLGKQLVLGTSKFFCSQHMG